MLKHSTPKRIFAVLSGLFLLSAFIGLFAAFESPQMAMNVVHKIAASFGIPSPDPLQNFQKIFLNNIVVASLITISGIFFGLGPLFFISFNGFIVGLVAGFAYSTGKASADRVLLALLPHGIVEIPAVILAGVGGILWYKEISTGDGRAGERFKSGAVKALKLLSVSVLLLFIAAIIEAYITPRIAGIT
ncbi:stage II sporulation protein M [Thermococcus sp.]